MIQEKLLPLAGVCLAILCAQNVAALEPVDADGRKCTIAYHRQTIIDNQSTEDMILVAGAHFLHSRSRDNISRIIPGGQIVKSNLSEARSSMKESAAQTPTTESLTYELISTKNYPNTYTGYTQKLVLQNCKLVEASCSTTNHGARCESTLAANGDVLTKVTIVTQ